MRDFIASIRIVVGFAIAGWTLGCAAQNLPPSRNPVEPNGTPTVVADRFAYPIGAGGRLTAVKDKKDEWFNALDFGEQDHLGEDWNKNSGGNSDCGEPVYAAANGLITFAGDAGLGQCRHHHAPSSGGIESSNTLWASEGDRQIGGRG